MTHRPPGGLSRASKKLWSAIAAEIELDAGAELILRVLCEAVDRRQEARDAIAADGVTVKDRWGQVKAHPALAIERDQTLAITRLYHALGLDMAPPSEG